MGTPNCEYCKHINLYIDTIRYSNINHGDIISAIIVKNYNVGAYLNVNTIRYRPTGR